MKLSKIVDLLLIGLMICLSDCSGGTAPGQLYAGTPLSSGTATIVSKTKFPNGLSIFIDGKWVNSVTESKILPGTYKISILAGICNYQYVSFDDTFTAAAGDVVTYFPTNASVLHPEVGPSCYAPGFSRTIAKSKI